MDNISNEDRSMRAVDQHMLDELRSSTNGCHVPAWNTSAKLSPPFRISPANLNIVFYNCTETAAVRPDGILADMGCGGGNDTFVRVVADGFFPNDETSGYAAYAIEGCDATVVPVMRSSSSSSGVANASDYLQLISDGFLLTWESDPARRDNSRTGRNIGIGIGVGCGGLIMGFFAFFVWYKHKNNKHVKLGGISPSHTDQ